VPTALRGAADDEVVLRLSDAEVSDGLADLRWALHDALLAGARRLVLDVSDVSSLSSSAVASFLAAHRTCRARGGGVVLTGANRRTEDLLHRTGLWRVLLLPEQASAPPGPGPRRGLIRRSARRA
jgi:anti-anti-sigma factor